MNRRTVHLARLILAGCALFLASIVPVGDMVGTMLGSSPATAQKCSALDRNGTRCNIADELNPKRPKPGGGTVVTTKSPPGPRFVWLNLLLSCDASVARGWTAMNDLGAAILDLSFLSPTATPASPGVLWIGELVDPVSGGTNSGYISCVGTGRGLPPLPPPIPTADEIWGAALTFEPQVNLDPYIRGLTGLETFMWYEGPTADTVTIGLNGYTVTASIQAARFHWDMGGDGRSGNRTYTTSQAGSADHPAASHTYALPGPVVVVHEIIWTGTSVLTGPGLPAGGITVDLGQAVLATARAYDVIEVRTPVVSGKGRGHN